MESRFGIIEGVVRTRVGYAGGSIDSPTYYHMGDHTETVQVDYNPQRISYDQLLDIFWKSHNPNRQHRSPQYRRAVFHHTEEQRRQALASKTGVENDFGRAVKTEVLPVRSFTTAEDYHQKYLLKSHRVLHSEMANIYPDHMDFIDSTAVAHLNGYAGGNGTADQLSREIDLLGLSADGRKKLENLVRR
ncbi:MAG: peptide-methionine (S)-S-oxide reductase [Desulfobacterales bacterium]